LWGHGEPGACQDASGTTPTTTILTGPAAAAHNEVFNIATR